MGQDQGRSVIATLREQLGRLEERLHQSDRRIWPRICAELEAWITVSRTNTTLRTRTVNVSHSGIYVLTRPGESLACGEAVQVMIMGPIGEEPRPAQAAVNCRARVVHRELLLGEDDHQVGVGFEFDRPQTIELCPRPVKGMPDHFRLV